MTFNISRTIAITLTAAVVLILVTAALGQQTNSPLLPAPKLFATPQQAAHELIQAAGAYDVAALRTILGAEGEDLFSSADPVHDKSLAAAFASKARAKNQITPDPRQPSRATLIVGSEEWPFPVPLVNQKGKWFFDAKAGRTEILYRRIGANELDAIQICRGYVEAQREYAAHLHKGSKINQYAQRIVSTPGKEDGLYWMNANGTPGGPISEGIARAIQEGYTSGKGLYHGYYFKILKGQGPAAPLGRIDYVIQGVMIGGFALVAVPAEYRVTGVKTFMVSNDGIVYEKDLGPKSLDLVKNMELYDPDRTWKRTNDQWPAPIMRSKALEQNVAE